MTKLPHFEVTWSFAHQSVSLQVGDDVPGVLHSDMLDVMRPFLGMAVRNPDELLHTLRFQLESWLRTEIRNGDLFYDSLRNCWRYGL